VPPLDGFTGWIHLRIFRGGQEEVPFDLCPEHAEPFKPAMAEASRKG
jgi:hypothetical protein